MVCELKKALYGIKQAPHEWNNTLDDFLRATLKFDRCTSDICVYFRRSKSGKLIILAVFVDDIVIAFHASDEKEWASIKQLITSKFKVKDLGDAQFILGMRIVRDRKQRTLHIDQTLYISKVLERFNMMKAKTAETPETLLKLSKAMSPQTPDEKEAAAKLPYMAVVGSTLYAALATRPDIAHAVNEVCRYMSCFGEKHWNAAKQVLRYLKGSLDQHLVYKPETSLDNTIRIQAFSDSDWAGDLDDRKSITGFIIKIDGCTVSWASKKQSIVSMSSAEAEYIALAETAKEVLWIKNFLTELTGQALHCTIFGDNQASHAIAMMPVSNDRSKHIDTRFHFIRDCVRRNEFELQWISTEYQLADIFTKALQKIKFAKLRSGILNTIA